MRVKPTMEETVAQEILAHYQSYYRLSYSYLKNKEDAMDALLAFGEKFDNVTIQ